MAVYEYSGRAEESEVRHIRGTVVARDPVEAYDRVRHEGMSHIHLKKVAGVRGLMQEWLARLGFRPSLDDE